MNVRPLTYQIEIYFLAIALAVLVVLLAKENIRLEALFETPDEIAVGDVFSLGGVSPINLENPLKGTIFLFTIVRPSQGAVTNVWTGKFKDERVAEILSVLSAIHNHNQRR